MKLSKSLRNVTIFPHPLMKRLCHSSVQIKGKKNSFNLLQLLHNRHLFIINF